MVAELRKLIAVLESKQQDCVRRLLRVKEAMAVHQTVQQQVVALLPPDSAAFRVFDRMRRERTFYWSGGSEYVESKDCGNFTELIGMLVAIVKELEPDNVDVGTLASDLARELEAQKSLMVAVSTGGPRIADVNGEYLERRQRLRRGLEQLGLEDPSPYDDLWAWYSKWSADLPSYRARRDYLGELFSPTIRQLSHSTPFAVQRASIEPTGWAKVDRNLGSARADLARAATELDYQQIGLICRETLIDLAQEVYDAPRHPAEDGVVPSSTDAKRMLDAYLSSELSGGENEGQRRHAKAALALANDLTHKRSAGFRQAALCVEATASVVNIVAIVSGRRDPDAIAT